MPKWGLKFYFKQNSYFWLSYEQLSSYLVYFTYPTWDALPPTTYMNIKSVSSLISKHTTWITCEAKWENLVHELNIFNE